MSRARGALVGVLALGLLPAALAAAPVHHELEVSLDPRARRLAASDIIELPADRPSATLLLDAGLQVETLRVDGRAHAPTGEVAAGTRRIALPPGARRVEVEWHARLAPLDVSQSHRDTLRGARAVSGEQGSFLPAASLWYPRVEGAAAASYRLRLSLPPGQRGLAPGTLLAERTTADGWQATFAFEHPAEGIDLVAGPYRVTRRDVAAADGRRLVLRTWFHAGLEALAADYLDSVADYIALYERQIGAYAFDGFNVVSSPTPSGFGMPGLAYLGIDVLRLPFIRHTSLGHEVLHDWWGNGVYVDYARGNWAEGLTTFMADYHFRERESAAAAREMRLGWLRDFAAVPASEDRPLVAFRARYHGASQVVGYNKAAMLFFMLRERIGNDAFGRGVARLWREYRFKTAAWGDLQRAFEAAAGVGLESAFAPWLERTGAPAVTLVEARAEGDGVRVTLAQAAPPWPLRVPVEFETAAGPRSRVLDFTSTRAEFHLALDAPAVAVRLDPEMRVFRRLAAREAPPILRDVMLAPAPRVLLLGEIERGAAETLAARLFDQPPRFVTDTGTSDADGLLVIGAHAAIDAWLVAHDMPPRPREAAADAGSASVWTGRGANGGVVAFVSLADAGALAPLLRPLPHYGRQSWIVFEGARAVARGAWPVNPQRVPVRD